MFRSTLLISSLFVSSAFSAPMPRHHHLDLDLTGPEYLRLLEKAPVKKNLKAMTSEDAEIERFLAIGKRNLQWVDFVNSTRDASRKLSLSSPATQGGNSVYEPRIYNFRIIKKKWEILESLLPSPLKKVIFEGAPFTPDIGVTDREFMEWLFQVDGAYQIASRYKMMLPYKTEMAGLAAYDVRGYVNLTDNENLNADLTNFDTLSDLTQAGLQRDLLKICMNSQKSRSDCKSELKAAVEGKTLVAFKDHYLASGKSVYDGFFNIAGTRPDGVWTSKDPENFHIPFANPHNDAVLAYLRDNIQDEWRWNGWQLHLDFVESTDPTMTHIVWEAGATPHVDNAPGTTITMDQNSLLSEYDVQWTIRHEYGHVLGFPDCYHEFYDEEQGTFVSYQLDVTNLMCSRRGHLKQTHYDELKRVYYKEI